VEQHENHGGAPGELNLSTFAKYFSDEEAAWSLMESLAWPNGEVRSHVVTNVTSAS
jgi:hypothetical protein